MLILTHLIVASLGATIGFFVAAILSMNNDDQDVAEREHR